MRETAFKVLTQGDVEMAHDVGYMVVGGDDAVCFFIDPKGRAFVEASTESPAGCPFSRAPQDLFGSAAGIKKQLRIYEG